jgi:hypothetical protein
MHVVILSSSYGSAMSDDYGSDLCRKISEPMVIVAPFRPSHKLGRIGAIDRAKPTKNPIARGNLHFSSSVVQYADWS